MVVVAGGNGELVASIGDEARELVAGTLEAHAAAVADSLSYEKTAKGRERQQRSLNEVSSLRRQFEGTAGPVTLSGPTPLVVEVVRDTATQAAHDLDALVENLAATPTRLSADAIAELRTRLQITSACVETVIACESGRGRG
jgi:hypothetical protein